MSDVTSRVRQLTVGDVMSKNVVTIGTNQSIAMAANVFLDYEVTAAPVIDEMGKFAGILSATDFLRRASDREDHQLEKEDDGECWKIGIASSDSVCMYMTKAVQTIAPDAPLLQAATMMTSQHIHRIPVIDTENQLVGIVSTMDITSALLKFVDELEITASSSELSD